LLHIEIKSAQSRLSKPLAIRPPNFRNVLPITRIIGDFILEADDRPKKAVDLVGSLRLQVSE